jgi:hypothetical protein
MQCYLVGVKPVDGGIGLVMANTALMIKPVHCGE